MNQTIVCIESLSHDGRGIAHINGKTVFIENALPNEKIKFAYIKRHNNFDEGKTTEIIEPAAMRTTPLCPHFGICGGCNLQHLKHAAQLELKQKTLLEQLEHFGKTVPQNIIPPLTGPIWHYRNKARLAVKYVQKKNKVLVGFHEKNGRFIADIFTCPVLGSTLSDRINDLSSLISQLSIPTAIPQIEVAITAEETALVLRHLKEFNADDLAHLKAFAVKHHYKIYLQPQGTESIHCLTAENLELNYKLTQQNLTLSFHPCDFTQTNHAINQKLVTLALELLAPNIQDKILDLFCGIGNFSLPLAQKCQKVIGVEGNNNAILRAKNNTIYNNIHNLEFYVADLTTLPQQNWIIQKFTKILLDPPRTGALEIIKNFPQFNAHKVLYVSCNPATLARDAQELIAQGFTLTHAGIIDMFPHTKHVEALALFSV